MVILIATYLGLYFLVSGWKTLFPPGLIVPKTRPLKKTLNGGRTDSGAYSDLLGLFAKLIVDSLFV